MIKHRKLAVRWNSRALLKGFFGNKVCNQPIFQIFKYKKINFSNVEANKNDKRNEPNLSRPSSAGETRKTLLKEVPIFAGHSDTELDDADLTLDLSSLGIPGQ